MQNYTDKINGFTVYGDINNKNAKQIVALGGSTTFHYLMDGLKCWPEFLHETLDRNGHMTTVACGGMSGYVSGQELLKLYRDVFFSFNPSVVISFSGYNDLSVRYSDFYEREKRPYLPANYGMVFKELKINSDFMFLGLETDINIAQCWLMNMRLMKAMCDELNIKFLSFLQPCLITSEPSEENLSVLDKSRYDLDAIRFYYNELKNEIKNYDYIIDLTDIFVNDKNVFFDIVHVTDRGNANISNRIYSELAKRQLI